MKKLALIVAVVCMTATTPASAHMQEKHALGNLYTKALNTIESQGMLDTLEPKQNVRVTDIHMDHGLIYVTVTTTQAEKTFTFDPMVNRLTLLIDKPEAKQESN